MNNSQKHVCKCENCPAHETYFQLRHFFEVLKWLAGLSVFGGLIAFFTDFFHKPS